MKRIPLTQGQYALVDDEDFERVNRFKWYAMKTRSYQIEQFIAVRQVRVAKNKQRTEYMHRFILGPEAGPHVDHEDRNTLNNQRYNIRPATRSQNNQNHPRRKSNTSGFKGVSLIRGKWKSEIRADGEYYYLGLFEEPEAAARAYDAKAVELHGKFARLNFPAKE